MKWQDYDQLVERLSGEYRQSPVLYKVKLALLALLAYVYIIFIVIASLMLLWLAFSDFLRHRRFFALELSIFFFFIVFICLRALWVTTRPPEGYKLTGDAEKRVLGMVNEIRARTRLPAVRYVLIDDLFNASVCQRPLLGIFGWNHYYLTIGLPLLLSLSPEGLRAVLAHELAHLDPEQGFFALWIYRVRTTIERMQEDFQRSGNKISSLFGKFFEWFFPLFSAYSFNLIRFHEYQADKLSGRIIGPKVTAEALVRIEGFDIFLNDFFWKKIGRRVIKESVPPADIYEDMLANLRSADDKTLACCSVVALRRKIHTEDPHPSLSDRISQLGVEGTNLMRSDGTGENIGILFCSEQERFLREMSARWQASNRDSWETEHKRLQASSEKLGQLESKRSAEELSGEELSEMAACVEAVRGGEESIELYRLALTKSSFSAGLHYSLGRVLLDKKDDEGISHILQAMRTDYQFAYDGTYLLYDYFIRQNRLEEAEDCYERLVRMDPAICSALEERSRLSTRDAFLPHRLGSEGVKVLVQCVAEQPGIEAAYLAEKKMSNYSEKPLYVLGLDFKRHVFRYEDPEKDRKLMDKLLERINCDLSGFECHVVVLREGDGSCNDYYRLLNGVENALVFERNKSSGPRYKKPLIRFQVIVPFFMIFILIGTILSSFMIPERNVSYRVERLSRKALKNPIEAVNYFIQRKDYPSALKICEDMIPSMGDNVSFYINLSILYLRTGNFDKAIEASKKLISIAPDYLDAYVYLAQGYRGKGQHDKAEETIRKVVEIDPDFPRKFQQRQAEAAKKMIPAGALSAP